MAVHHDALRREKDAPLGPVVATTAPPEYRALFSPTQVALLEWLRAQRPALEEIPIPGDGRTLQRWRYLAATAAEDASRARLAEGHLDALAILHELGRRDVVGPEQLWGVWAAEPGDLHAERTASGWHLHGVKRWCSGSVGLDAALLTATSGDGTPLLFAAPTKGLGVVEGSWQPLGMAGTASHTLTFDLWLSLDAQIGEPGAYVGRPGFWHGGIGVAVCWYGIAVALARSLATRSRSRSPEDPYTTAALGRSIAILDSVRALLRGAGDEIDRTPLDTCAAQRRAMGVRVSVEDAARRVLETTVAVLSADALCHDRDLIARIADLTVYLGQHHGDRDAAAYGRLVSLPEHEL